MKKEIETEKGKFTPDASGVWHYRTTTAGGWITCFTQDAVKSKISGFFWFNGIYCPIEPGDTSESLADRWSEWREAYQKGKLLEKIIEYSLGDQK